MTRAEAKDVRRLEKLIVEHQVATYAKDADRVAAIVAEMTEIEKRLGA